MATYTGGPTVLVVDDEEDVADALAAQLGDQFDARVAYGGREALAQFDESVDAVLLDRRMPDLDGDEVLAEIRERGPECVVIMTTAVDPDLNILEMDFDDYLVKPIETETVREALNRHLETRRDGDDRLGEFFSVMAKIDVLEAEHPPEVLAENEEYAALIRRVEQLRQELDTSREDFQELAETFQEISREP